MEENLSILRGKGVYLTLNNNKKYLDLTSGATITNLGHSNKAIAKSIFNQARQIDSTYLFDSPVSRKYTNLLLKELNRSIIIISIKSSSYRAVAKL